jgi:hypothetical protein
VVVAIRAAVLAAVGLGATTRASADGPAPPTNGGAAARAEVRPARLRLGLSPAAASFLTEPRVRALLEVELVGVLPIAEGSIGPLDEPAIRAFIDQPDASSVVIQVQAPGRALTLRRVDVTGLGWDVAARFTAIATAEIVRAQLAPVRVRRRPPRKPTEAELDAVDRRRPRVVVAAAAHAAIGSGPARFGPELALGHATPVVDVAASGLFTAGDDGRRVGTVEAALTASHRLHFAPWLRAEAGAVVGVGTATLGEGASEDAAGFGHLAARVGLGARLAPDTWLSLRVLPGGIVGGPTDAAEQRPLEGASLGVALALSREIPIEPAPASPARP